MTETMPTTKGAVEKKLITVGVGTSIRMWPLP